MITVLQCLEIGCLSEQKKTALTQHGFTFVSYYVHRKPKIMLCSCTGLSWATTLWKAVCSNTAFTSSLFKVPNLFPFLQSNSSPLSKLLSNRTPHTGKAAPHTPYNSNHDFQTCNQSTSPKTANLALPEIDEILLSTGKFPYQDVWNKTQHKNPLRSVPNPSKSEFRANRTQHPLTEVTHPQWVSRFKCYIDQGKRERRKQVLYLGWWICPWKSDWLKITMEVTVCCEPHQALPSCTDSSAFGV